MTKKDSCPFTVSRSRRDTDKWAVFKDGRETPHNYRDYDAAVTKAQAMNKAHGGR